LEHKEEVSTMSTRPCWIETIPEHEAEGRLREAYEQVGRPDGTVHNLYKAFSLWPTPMPWADALYRAILHSDDAVLPKWFQELIATQVAMLAGCNYAFTHHGANFKALLGDEARGEAMLQALRDGAPDSVFDKREAEILRYNAKLAEDPKAMSEADIMALREAGVSDTEILEVNQIGANFAYWVRVINGLGIQLGDERVGLYA
jgi:uncharacterized peroxidase-related enzyme